MSTRSRARVSSGIAKATSPPSTTTNTSTRKSSIISNQLDKENTKTRTTTHIKGKTTKASAPKSSSRRGAGAPFRLYCQCKKPDDGSPMINCALCDDWYHFKCVDLTESAAEDISAYVCPPCTTKSGLRTTRDWEGLDALEQHPHPHTTSSSNHSQQEQSDVTPGTQEDRTEDEAHDEPQSEPAEHPSDSESLSSGDEYVAESKQADLKHKGARKAKQQQKRGKGKRIIRRLSNASANIEEDSDSEGDAPGRSKGSSSPGPSAPNKRKPKDPDSGQAPPSKRKRSDTESSGADPARKFCLAKLQEVFVKIFLKYPPPLSGKTETQEDNGSDEKAAGGGDQAAAAAAVTGGDGGGQGGEEAEAEKARLVEEATKFASQLEECIYELYAEADKTGKRTAAGKYKERFRMLHFNLSKEDRTTLHKSITSSLISPSLLSTMSSTELANEQMKESIKNAEKENLAHSILKQTLVPRAKITHKGLQDIEDLSGNLSSGAGGVVDYDERARELEQERERERERMARLRAVPPARAALDSPVVPPTPTSASMPPPPESPMTPQAHGTTPWGASSPGDMTVPSPITMHTLQHPGFNSLSSMSAFVPLHASSSMSLYPSVDEDAVKEGEMRLGDLINLEDDPDPVGEGVVTGATGMVGPSASAIVTAVAGGTSEGPFSPFTPVTPTAESSHAPAQSRPSFNLDSLWTKKPDSGEDTTDGSTAPQDSTSEQQQQDQDQDQQMTDADIAAPAADDTDFDMFLVNKDKDNESVEMDITPPPSPTLEEKPAVWTGKLSMPLDSATPENTPVSARQIGGRLIPFDSPLWQALFPTPELRIEGRVPVDKSAEFLLQIRMNSSKELIAVAFLPTEDAESTEKFNVVSTFLINKSRHGLIFPWGPKAKDNYPGRELYLVPLRASEPIPEFIQLLDNMSLPKTRSADCMVGIWILNRGRLKIPHAPQPSQSAPALACSHFPSNLPSLSAAPPAQPFAPPGGLGPVQNASVEPDVLAAEVAALTPEQIQAMLKALSASNGGVLASGGAPVQPPSGSHRPDWPPYQPGGYHYNQSPSQYADSSSPPRHQHQQRYDGRGGYNSSRGGRGRGGYHDGGERRVDGYSDRGGGYRGGRGRGRGRGRGGGGYEYQDRDGEGRWGRGRDGVREGGGREGSHSQGRW